MINLFFKQQNQIRPHPALWIRRLTSEIKLKKRTITIIYEEAGQPQARSTLQNSRRATKANPQPKRPEEAAGILLTLSSLKRIFPYQDP
jgi:hypothetical protein